MQLRRRLVCPATHVIGKAIFPSHICAQRAWTWALRTQLRVASSWTIDVPAVDAYLKKPPDNIVGELQEVLCEVGSLVHVDEEVAVIETDKVAVSVTAHRNGIISAILAKPGDEVKESQPIYEAHDVPMKTTLFSRRWAREHAQRKAIREEEEELERHRILKMWEQRREKEKQARQRRRAREGSNYWHRQESAKDHWQRRGDSTAGQHHHSQGIRDAFATLELKPGASKRAIKTAFRKMAMQYHPDRNADSASAEKFKAARAAYDVLMRT